MAEKKSSLTLWSTALSVVFLIVALMMPNSAGATSQWSRKTGLPCSTCHSVFPRLNSFGEEFLRNGYQLITAHKKSTDTTKTESEYSEGEVFLDKVDHLFGFRLNMTPFMVETNAFQKDSGSAKESRLTLGNPVWIQFFVAGSIYKDISFFSELEYAASSFKFNWFYFNFTNISGSEALNFQVGNISPLEFASYPDRLPQLSNIKGEVFHIRSSNGAGENSTKIRDAHPGIQYFGRNDWALWYAGVSPGKAPVSISQFVEYWGGLVFKMPDNVVEGFEGSTATLHLQKGNDTKNTGQQVPERRQVTNAWTRIAPSVNIRYNEKLDIQAAYLFGTDDNWYLVSNPSKSFKFSGVAVEAGYMPNETWHLGLHYDKYSSDDNITSGPNAGKSLLEFQRIVPVATYIVNQNMRFSVYYEKDLSEGRKDATGRVIDLVDRLYLNIRMMF